MRPNAIARAAQIIQAELDGHMTETGHVGFSEYHGERAAHALEKAELLVPSIVPRDKVWYVTREWVRLVGWADRMHRGKVVADTGDGSFAVRRCWTRTVLNVPERDVIK